MIARQLKRYCDAEFENVDATLHELDTIYRPGQASYSIAELAAVATFLHNIYNGLENILKRVLQARGRVLSRTATWHKDLLNLALEEKIVSQPLYDQLLTYLSFRHYFVHSYVFSLEWQELQPLVMQIEATIATFKRQIEALLPQDSSGV